MNVLLYDISLKKAKKKTVSFDTVLFVIN